MNEKTCILCRHWVFWSASPGYSELTPGSDAEEYCAEEHWNLDGYEYQDDRRKCLLKAQNCKDFVDFRN